MGYAIVSRAQFVVLVLALAASACGSGFRLLGSCWPLHVGKSYVGPTNDHRNAINPFASLLVLLLGRGSVSYATRGSQLRLLVL
ncbi:hypothetical protein MNBD_ACTINO02-3190 [hydrothermal vent metagenome]|uniref:Uncharacterized protein n=1 Tax=hydrothermal vent metagenome TaxID=652676 RepID=A0A3B0T4J0_9ZZZZ